MKAEIYTKDGCYYCDLAKNLFGMHKIKYTEKNIGQEHYRDELKEAKPSAKTVPQIWIDGKYVGGYDELNSLIIGMTS